MYKYPSKIRIIKNIPYNTYSFEPVIYLSFNNLTKRLYKIIDNESKSKLNQSLIEKLNKGEWIDVAPGHSFRKIIT